MPARRRHCPDTICRSSAMRYRFDGFELDTQRFVLRTGDREIHVEPLVFDLLRFLVEHAGEVVTREAIIEQVWEGRIVSDATVSSCIKSVRKALGDDGAQQRHLRTIRARGFQFDRLGRVPARGRRRRRQPPPFGRSLPARPPPRPPAQDPAAAKDRRPAAVPAAAGSRARPARRCAGAGGDPRAVAPALAVRSSPAAPRSSSAARRSTWRKPARSSAPTIS